MTISYRYFYNGFFCKPHLLNHTCCQRGPFYLS